MLACFRDRLPCILKHAMGRIFFQDEPEGINKHRKEEVAGFHLEYHHIMAAPATLGLFSESEPDSFAPGHDNASARNFFSPIQAVPMRGKERTDHVVY